MIIYLHGFAATGEAKKAEWLRSLFPDEIVVSPTYPSNDADEAMRIIDDVIVKALKTDDNVMLVGSSMGGFFAQYIGKKYNVKVVLINPAIHFSTIAVGLIGTHKNFITGEAFTFSLNTLEGFQKYEITDYHTTAGVLVLLDSGDEVLDHTKAVDAYEKVGHVVVFDGGNHRFAHTSEAENYVKGLYYTMFF